jgi:hypothetical protein
MRGVQYVLVNLSTCLENPHSNPPCSPPRDPKHYPIMCQENSFRLGHSGTRLPCVGKNHHPHMPMEKWVSCDLPGVDRLYLLASECSPYLSRSSSYSTIALSSLDHVHTTRPPS